MDLLRIPVINAKLTVQFRNIPTLWVCSLTSIIKWFVSIHQSRRIYDADKSKTTWRCLRSLAPQQQTMGGNETQGTLRPWALRIFPPCIPVSSLSWAANRFGKSVCSPGPLRFKLPYVKQMAHTLSHSSETRTVVRTHNALARMGNNESAKSTLVLIPMCPKQRWILPPATLLNCFSVCQWCWRRWFHHRWTEAARYGLCVDGRPP